ncbi:tRNA (N6-isopentenyl adenosine(37)-C2)-methylthiotransferase MiaB [Candidatus Peregrinibacteria bacterium CG11_big_fil_rev_8_21_14_0_20_46_8]|nr:MAG: tRNA (N6-isopentenyl adenosine(37)-C2)-methylthiotransferase MiaB [Candidatus Peregrinibacteria bacterium CG11_big_fil_rev_8_21_14_0_20_46_8]
MQSAMITMKASGGKATRNSTGRLKYHVKTFGCQFNYSDSERVASLLEEIGYAPTENEVEADFIILNTCAIRQKAEDRVYGLFPHFQELKQKNSRLKIGITGCMVRKSSSKVSRKKDRIVKNYEEIDITFRINELQKLPDLLRELDPELDLNEAADEFDAGTLQNYFKINPKYSNTVQAFVPIAYGCDKFCAFCIVPFSRGREKSRLMQEILDECEQLVARGCKEITLLGQTVDSYGLSFDDRATKRFAPLKKGEKIYFTRLLEELDRMKFRGLKRVRWTSPHPKDMTDDLIEAVARLETQMPYIHLPIQSGSTAMLKRMNRPYTRERYLDRIAKIREHIPDCAISTDIIVGFCGETEEMFEDTLSLYEEIRWDMAFIAQYSMRKFTAAHRTMKDDVPSKIKQKRWHELNEILKQCSREGHERFVGKTVEVLVERVLEDGRLEGRSEHYKRTQFKGTEKMIGELVQIKVEEAGDWYLTGAVI